MEAEQVQERAVAIAENVYGTDHPQVQYFFFFLLLAFLRVPPSMLPVLSLDAQNLALAVCVLFMLSWYFHPSIIRAAHHGPCRCLLLEQRGELFGHKLRNRDSLLVQVVLALQCRRQ